MTRFGVAAALLTLVASESSTALAIDPAVDAGRRAAAVSISAARCGIRRDDVRGDLRGSVTPIRPVWQGDAIQRAQFTIRLAARGASTGGLLNRVVALRIDPRRVRLGLDVARDGDAMAPWSIDDAPDDALVAFNAGQFTDDGPWGWVVHRGREWQAPGSGSLSGALVIDSAGGARLLSADDIAPAREASTVVEAVQSYPMLLAHDAVVPTALCDAASGVDLTHRDARLAIGITADGAVIVVLTRYEIMGTVSRVPIGPTTPEMASLMQRLGAERAMLLDGGLSAQLMTRGPAGVDRWPGIRRVPLALVGTRR